MPSRKVLKSVAHNLGHSFLSLMNYWADDYVVEWLYRTAKKTSIPNCRIDFTKGTIDPAEFRIAPVQQSVEQTRSWLPQFIESHGAEPGFVKSLVMDLTFDLTKTRMSKHVQKLELAVYDCRMKLMDDRNKLHTTQVVEWWRY